MKTGNSLSPNFVAYLQGLFLYNTILRIPQSLAAKTADVQHNALDICHYAQSSVKGSYLVTPEKLRAN